MPLLQSRTLVVSSARGRRPQLPSPEYAFDSCDLKMPTSLAPGVSRMIAKAIPLFGHVQENENKRRAMLVAHKINETTEKK